MEGYEKLEYIGCDLKKGQRGGWLLLAKFRGSNGCYDWAPKWAQELDRLYASAYLVELLNGGETLKGFKETYEMLNQGMLEALEKAEAEVPEADKQEFEKLRQNWKQMIEQAPEDTKRTPAMAIMRSVGTWPVAFENDRLVLGFRYPLHKETMEKPQNQGIAEKIISEFLRRPCHIECIYQPEDEEALRAALYGKSNAG